MKVYINRGEGIFMLEPRSTEEYEMFVKIAKQLKFGDELFRKYCQAPLAEDLLEQFPELRKSKYPLDRTTLVFGYSDGLTIEIAGDDESDEEGVGVIRGSVFWFKRIIYLRSSFSNGSVVLEFTIGNCKRCGRFCVERRDLCYMCDDCACSCNHVYDFVPAYAEDRDGKPYVSVAHECTLCARSDPNFNVSMYSDEELRKLALQVFNVESGPLSMLRSFRDKFGDQNKPE